MSSARWELFGKTGALCHVGFVLFTFPFGMTKNTSSTISNAVESTILTAVMPSASTGLPPDLFLVRCPYLHCYNNHLAHNEETLFNLTPAVSPCLFYVQPLETMKPRVVWAIDIPHKRISVPGLCHPLPKATHLHIEVERPLFIFHHRNR